MFNAHEVIGWFNCANLLCRHALTCDHVMVTTTAHMRRFCCVECITEGQRAWYDFLKYLYDSFGDQVFNDADALMRDELPKYIAALADAQGATQQQADRAAEQCLRDQFRRTVSLARARERREGTEQ